MRSGRSAALALLAVLVWLTAAPSNAGAQERGVLGYCEPSATQFDPADVPASGSDNVTAKGVRERTIAIQGIAIRVLVSGPRRADARRTVVLLHGELGSAADWNDLLPRLGRRGIRTIAFDLPGYGHASPAWDFPHTFASYTEFFGRMLDRLRVRRANLVLHDIAGPIAFEWALEHPRRTGRISLIDGGVLLDYVPHPVHVTYATPGLGEASQLTLDRMGFETFTSEGQTMRPLPEDFVTRSYDDLDRETRCAALAFFGQAISGSASPEAAADQAARLAAEFPRKPVQVIWGRNDPYLRVNIAERQRDAFPRASVTILEESGHWPFADDPRRVRRLVLPFVTRRR